MREPRVTDRRNFLRSCIAGVVGLTAAESSFAADLASPLYPPPLRSRVSIARDALLRGSPPRRAGLSAAPDSGSGMDAGRILNLLDRAMQGLFPAEHPAHAWSRIARPGQTVGIKVNSLGGHGLSSHPAVVEAICERLQGVGVPAGNIVIWDRDSSELERAGFRIATHPGRIQCFGTDRVGFEDRLSSFGTVGSRVSKILTRCEVLINVPVLKDHDGAGVSIALKNLYGAIHNPNKYHPNGCDPFVADVNMLPEVRGRMKLTVCDATTACYEGGPSFKPQFTWRENALIVARDPVALDTIGWHILERKRAQRGLKTLEAEGRPPLYIATAADATHRLGNIDPGRITVIESEMS